MNCPEWHKVKCDMSGFVSRGVRECEVDDNGHLMFTMTDNEVLDLGRVMGIDGVSPAISVEEIEGGHKLTITDAEHPDGQEINVMNGADGVTIDDEHAAPAHPWSGEKTSSELNTKVDKEAGKGLSTQDFTTTLKEKLDGIEQGANKTVIVNNTTTDDATKALSAAQGKKLSDAVAAIKTISNGQWWVYVDDNPRCYHYEGGSATANKLPYANVDVHVQFYGHSRGTAYAIRWDTNGANPDMWVCSLHDDADPREFGAWKKLVTEPKSVTYLVEDQPSIDSSDIVTGGFSIDNEILNVSIDVENIIVLWDFHQGRIFFHFYAEDTFWHSYITGTLTVLYR